MKTIAVTFAGRKRYMEILFKYILKYREHIDEYHLYLATTNQDDVDYIEEFQERNSDFVSIVRLETYENFNRTKVWNLCYLNCRDEDSVYVKIDDDVVYLDERLFTEFIEFRKTSKSPLVFPHIINNIISSPVLEEHDRIKLPEFDNDSKVYYTWRNTIKRIHSQVNSLKNKMDYDFVVSDLVSQNEILCPVVWGNLGYSLAIHEEFLHKLSNIGVESLYTENVKLENFEPMSIQCCSWLGKDFKKYIDELGKVGSEDEPWMAVYLPLWLDSPHTIFGGSIVSHFSSYNQDSYLLENGILEKYKILI
jgi:glycosyltransferase involved in cell wall biosynthesis